MRPLLVLNVVALTPELLPHAPRISGVAREGSSTPLDPVLPAVTCTVQSSMLTGRPPSGHGIVANGWYDRERAEVGFWKQSNHLVRGDMVWDAARRRDPACTTANLFWWFNMYGSADYSVTPRPAYPADGRKIPDCYAHPADLRDRLQAHLGTFPLFKFWGPTAGIESTRWIAEAANLVLSWHRPTVSLVYLPHLDYPLQKVGPDHPSIPAEVAAVDAEAGRIIDAHRALGYGVLVLSGYGITPVTDAVFPNRALREAGLTTYRVDATGELLDHGACRAFAVPDHQICHVYVADPADVDRTREVVESLAGVDRVLVGDDRAQVGLDHPRSGEIVAFSKPDRWFAHDWWNDAADAPDYQRTVDIHRKPGYDPRELFFDPSRPLTGLRAAAKIAFRKLGFRNLLDVVPLDTSLVRGSHGLPPASPNLGPLVVSDTRLAATGSIHQTDVKDLILSRVFDEAGVPVGDVTA